MKSDIIVTRFVNDQPAHANDRGSAHGPSDIARQFGAAVAGEVDRLHRGFAFVDIIELSDSLVVLHVDDPDASAAVVIEARPR